MEVGKLFVRYINFMLKLVLKYLTWHHKHYHDVMKYFNLLMSHSNKTRYDEVARNKINKSAVYVSFGCACMWQLL